MTRKNSRILPLESLPETQICGPKTQILKNPFLHYHAKSEQACCIVVFIADHHAVLRFFRHLPALRQVGHPRLPAASVPSASHTTPQ